MARNTTTPAQNEKLYLVDSSSLFFRAFFAIRELSAPDGTPTNAIYGFLQMLLRLVKEEQAQWIVCCLDRKEASFRAEIFPEYKANRSEPPDKLVPQFPYLRILPELLGVPVLDAPGFEADDLIATLTRWGRSHGREVVIVSGDKDFAQLVEPGVVLLDTMKQERLDSQGVLSKWGVRPDQMVDYLALVGDSSDNIPGVSGIGPKGAQKLLQDFGSLSGIYQNLEKVSGDSLRQKLAVGKDSALLSKRLVELSFDVSLPSGEEAFRRQPARVAELRDLAVRLNFKGVDKWLSDLGGNSSEQARVELTPQQTQRPPSLDDGSSPVGLNSIHLNQAAVGLESDRPVLVVSPTQLLSHLGVRPQLWVWQGFQGFYLAQGSQIFQMQGELSELGRLLDPLDVQWSGHDLKKLWHSMELQKGGSCQWDSLLAAYILKAGENLEWDHLIPRFLGAVPPELPSPEQMLSLHLRLQSELTQRLEKIGGLSVLKKIDLPCVRVLYEMERRGIGLDRELLMEQSRELAQELVLLVTRIHELAKGEFNIASPKQLAQVLFERLQLPPQRKTKTGYSTDEEVLQKLRHQHPIVEEILVFRELTKLKSTYVDALPALVKADGRIHTSLHQAVTTTGRLSSADPNLQNIPIRTVRGARVRQAFVARKGEALLSADYSQIELRVLAQYSQDPNLLKAFNENLDIHAITAAEVFGVDVSRVDAEMRRRAKAVNFGIAYGQGAFGLAENLGISRTESAEIIRRYFERFPGVRDYIESTTQLAIRDGFVETWTGRRRYIDELTNQNPAVRRSGERSAINAPIQGTASDIVKLAMIQLASEVPLPLILQIHDELIFESTEAQLREWAPRVTEIMEGIGSTLGRNWQVPLRTNWAIGANWDAAH